MGTFGLPHGNAQKANSADLKGRTSQARSD